MNPDLQITNRIVRGGRGGHVICTFNLKFDLLTFFHPDSSINNRICQEQGRSEETGGPRRWNRLLFCFRLCSALQSCPAKLHLCPQIGKIFNFFLKYLVTVSNAPPTCASTHTHTQINYGSPDVVKTHQTHTQLKELPTRIKSNTISPLMMFSTLHLFTCFISGRKSLN